MKIENGKIVEATTTELYSLYLRREMDLIMSFPEYMEAMRIAGCKVNDSKNKGQE